MSAAVIVVPPLLKYLAGPLLGPAMLAGAGRRVGAEVRVVDLNAAWLRIFPTRGVADGLVVGDHARPSGGFRDACESWLALLGSALRIDAQADRAIADTIWALQFQHDVVIDGAARLADGRFGTLVRQELSVNSRPHLFGVSVLWSGQVLGALACSMVARRLWPGVPIIWGGSHVAALAQEIASDDRYGELVDGFVAGPAEATFAEMLLGDPRGTPGVFRAGGRRALRAIEDTTTIPVFSNLFTYGSPQLTLPAQTVRGCSFGRCAFCTYPSIEGRCRDIGLRQIARVADRAHDLRAAVAVKDAYVEARRLREIATVVRGRAPWSACTRLVERLGRETLIDLSLSGLRTLEVGVESLNPATLRAMRKHQAPELIDQLLEDAAGLNLHVILNTMFGFPNEPAEQAAFEERSLRVELAARFPASRFSIERNKLQVERRSLLARTPDRFGLRVTGEWPWASVLGWEEHAPTTTERHFSVRMEAQ